MYSSRLIRFYLIRQSLPPSLIFIPRNISNTKTWIGRNYRRIALGRNGTSLNTWGSMFNFLLPFLTKKEHLCVPDYSSSRGTSLQGVYALSTLLLHASQSWPLSRKQITPVLAIVNFFFAAARAHRRSIKLPSNLHRARFLGKSGSGTINNKERKTSRREKDRSSVDRGAVIF